MKNTFGKLISILDMAEERISELEDISVKTTKLKSKEKKDWGKNQNKNIKK